MSDLASHPKTQERLLYALSVDPTASYASIAKTCGVSSDAVRYRVEQLLHSGTVRCFATAVNLSMFGFSHYQVFFQLRSATPALVAEFLQHLISFPAVTAVVRFDGEFDLGCALRLRSPVELSHFLQTVLVGYHKYLFRKNIQIYIGAEYFSRDYLLGKKKRRPRTPKAAVVPKAAEIDETDKFILRKLATNCRVSHAEIAREMEVEPDLPSITREAVHYRIKNLEKRGIITGYWMVLVPEKIGLLHYKIMLALDPVEPSAIDNFRIYISACAEVVLVLPLVGAWDIEVDIEVRSVAACREFMMALTGEFPTLIRNYTSLLVSGIEKWDLSGVI